MQVSYAFYYLLEQVLNMPLFQLIFGDEVEQVFPADTLEYEVEVLLVLKELNQLDHIRVVAHSLQDLDFIHLKRNLMWLHCLLVDILDGNDFIGGLRATLIHLAEGPLTQEVVLDIEFVLPLRIDNFLYVRRPSLIFRLSLDKEDTLE